MTRVFVAKDGDNKPHGWVDASLGMVVVIRSPNRWGELDNQISELKFLQQETERIEKRQE